MYTENMSNIQKDDVWSIFAVEIWNIVEEYSPFYSESVLEKLLAEPWTEARMQDIPSFFLSHLSSDPWYFALLGLFHKVRVSREEMLARWKWIAVHVGRPSLVCLHHALRESNGRVDIHWVRLLWEATILTRSDVATLYSTSDIQPHWTLNDIQWLHQQGAAFVRSTSSLDYAAEIRHWEWMLWVLENHGIKPSYPWHFLHKLKPIPLEYQERFKKQAQRWLRYEEGPSALQPAILVPKKRSATTNVTQSGPRRPKKEIPELYVSFQKDPPF